MAAAYKGNLDIIKNLIQFGADPSLKNCSGLSAYDWAKTFGRKEITLYFEKTSAESFNKDSQFRTWLRFLKLASSVLQIKILKNKGS